MIRNVRHCETSNIGLQRQNNEDSFLVVDQLCSRCDVQKYGMLFVIADGLGGHAAGEIASKMACEETVAGYYAEDLIVADNLDDVELKIQKLEKTIWSVHNKIIEYAGQQEKLCGMGTTLSALVLTADKAIMAHVGDSRIYRLRNNSCEMMTVDHTKSQVMIDGFQIRPGQEIPRYYGRILTQALGGYDDLFAVFTRVENVQSGDVFLLCTDGLHDLVTDNEIREILIENPLPHTACDKLVQAAISNGGHDDVTVIVIQL